MSIVVDPNDYNAVINAQHEWLKILQSEQPKAQILIKAVEGKAPEKADYDLYKWLPYPSVWYKIKEPIYTRGILQNEILIDPDTPEWSVMKDGIEKLTDYCKENDVPFIMGFSGGKGIHVSIFYGNVNLGDSFFDEINKIDIDVHKTIRKALITELAEKAGVDLDRILMDQGKINFNVESKGSQVRTFGTTRAPGQYKTLINEIPDYKPEPYELPLVFPEKVKLWEITGTEFENVVINALKVEVERAKKANEHTFNDIDFSGIDISEFPCIRKLFESGIRNGRYYAGISLLLMCEKCGIIKEETKVYLRRLFATFPDIISSDIDLRINNVLTMYGKGYKFSCRKVKETFGEEFCDFSNCPVKEKIYANKKKIAEKEQKVDKKYDGMYTMRFVSKSRTQVRIDPHPDKIADWILKNNGILTYKETIFVYIDGCYRSENETVVDKVTRTLNDICKGINSSNIDRKIRDIMAQIRTKSRVNGYPFNDYKNALPVENGIVIFDFENQSCKLIDHNPTKYRFNYKISIKYDSLVTNSTICDTLKNYTDTPDKLIQIPAQSFMQAMGHGPYKRAYLVYGKKNSGKTTFVELMERIVGHDGFCDISLDKISQRFQIASLEGKLLNLHDDMGYFTLNDTGTFKTLTGRRQHDIERKGVQPYVATLDAVHVFTTNTPAKFDSRIKTDEAYWERWEFITFGNEYGMKGDFKEGIFTPENLTAFLNVVIDEMLKIGQNGKLSSETDWYEAREKWMLAGNPLYCMVNELMEPEILEIKSSWLKGSRGMAIIKEELLKSLQIWCLDTKMDSRAIPNSLKDLTGLVDACGWDTDSQRTFYGNETHTRCYLIPYKWKETSKALKYNANVTDVATKQAEILNRY
jgi:phage/plasmid-associated DNA primase